MSVKEEMPTWVRRLVSQLVDVHPLPWSIEKDWTFEVLDARGAVVAKFPTSEEAREFRAFAQVAAEAGNDRTAAPRATTRNEGEWHFVCPVDGKRNRLLFDDYGVDWEKRHTVGVAAEPTFKRIYRRLFGSSKDTYGDDASQWENNYYVDQHRAQFELPPKPEKKK